MNYDGNMNVLVIGGSGAGKTRYYVKPNVCQMNSDLFITDPKGDLLLDVGNMLTNNGYEIRSFNTFFPDRSLIYNPSTMSEPISKSSPSPDCSSR